MSGFVLRPYADRDLNRVTEIYNDYVRTSIATFDLEPVAAAEYAHWVEAHTSGEGHGLWVAEQDGQVIGYAGCGPFRPRRAYDRTAEVSIYLDPAQIGRGLGTALYARLFDSLASARLHRLVAVIALPNPASVALHQPFGFREVGRLSQVGWKLGEFRDVALFERAFP